MLAYFSSKLVNKGINNPFNVLIDDYSRSILCLGQKFIPWPRPINKTSMLSSINEFEDRLRGWVTKFNNTETYNTIDRVEYALHTKLFKKGILKGIQKPTKKADPALETYFANAKMEIMNAFAEPNRKSCKRERFLNKQRRKLFAAMNRIKNSKDIIIKPADKNLGLTLLNRDDYITKGYNFLDDESTYKRIHEKPLASLFINDLKSILIKNDIFYHKKNIGFGMSNLAKDLLCNLDMNKEVNLGYMYFLPKIHKNPISVRPICSSCSMATFSTSILLDLLLQPLMKKSKTYIKDSKTLLYILENNRYPSGCNLYQSDVESLYPSINLDDGLSALKNRLKCLSGYKEELQILILELTEWVLRNNYIEFGDRMYLQIKGTAMGTPVAVAFACIYMSELEEIALKEVFTQFGFAPLLLVRFIDDYYMITLNKDMADIIHTALNSQSSNIKIIRGLDDDRAAFMDILTYKGDGFLKYNKIDVMINQKDTNQYIFLTPNSCHSPNIFKAWITSYIKRIRITCSDDDMYVIYKELFRCQLINRGYDYDVLQPMFNIVHNRMEILRQNWDNTKTNVLNNQKQIIAFKLRYCEKVKNLLPLLRRVLNDHTYACESPAYRDIQKYCRILVCLTNAKNLSQMIIRTRLFM